MGLSICARLVQCMGGKIWAESEKDRGSTFSFTIVARKSGDLLASEIRGSLNLLQQQKTPSPSAVSPRISSHNQIVQALYTSAPVALKAVSPSTSPTSLLSVQASQTPPLYLSALSPPMMSATVGLVDSSGSDKDMKETIRELKEDPKPATKPAPKRYQQLVLGHYRPLTLSFHIAIFLHLLKSIRV